MGKVYKDKKGSSCHMCKPHKNGWAKKFKDKERLERDEWENEWLADVNEKMCNESQEQIDKEMVEQIMKTTLKRKR